MATWKLSADEMNVDLGAANQSRSFGRKDDNDLVIFHPSVSSHHGKVETREDHVLFYDWASTNGTAVDGDRVEVGKPGVAREGSQVRLGALFFGLTKVE